MRPGKRSVRIKIFLLLVAPLVSVLGLWAFAASVTAGDALTKLRTDTITDNLSRPLGGVHGQFPPEALLSVVAMGTHSPADRKALSEQRARTDAGLAALRSVVNSSKVRDSIGAPLRASLDQLVQQFGQVTEIRAGVDSGTESRLGVLTAYGELIRAALKVGDEVAVEALIDIPVYRETNQVYTVLQANDLLIREGAVLVGALSAGARSLDGAETAAFRQYVTNRRLLLQNVTDREDPTFGATYQTMLGSTAYSTLTSLEDQVVALDPGAPLRVDVKAFQGATKAVAADTSKATNEIVLGLLSRAEANGRPTLIRLGLAGGLGLLAVALSLLLSIRLGRGLARELTGLQDAARDLAEQRLPRIMERLRNDEPVDVEAEAPPLEIGETTEVAKVGEAFTTVQRTAVEAAIGQANLRRGVRQVFLNLARRSQSLLHRQLSMLDAMERKASDPDALDELFRLDHLTTRMRRHAEGLIILSGALPARAWSTPVRVVDVVRAAIAEVESYTRVRVFVLSEASLLGAVVADVTHLIAELVENATSFSPPHTQVQVRAEAVGNGFVVEIEDAGLGMSAEQLAEVNARLAKPPDFDLADTDRLGLFVVAQLAGRHGIKVTVRSSPYGGTTAIILVPAHLVATDGAGATPEALDSRGWARAAARRGQGMRPVGNGVPNSLSNGASNGLSNGLEPAPPALDAGSDTPALTGRHRRIAGFLQRTRELQPEDPQPRPRVSTEWLEDDERASRGAAKFDLWATSESSATSAGTHAGLPRRVRRASLAPQLRDAPPADTDDLEQESDGVRSPEQARALMSSMQSGWQRGRFEAGPPPGVSPPPGPAGQRGPAGEERR